MGSERRKKDGKADESTCLLKDGGLQNTTCCRRKSDVNLRDALRDRGRGNLVP
jgi:hypothetical protein